MWKDEKGFIKRSVNCEEDFLYETGYDKNWGTVLKDEWIIRRRVLRRWILIRVDY